MLSQMMEIYKQHQKSEAGYGYLTFTKHIYFNLYVNEYIYARKI